MRFKHLHTSPCTYPLDHHGCRLVSTRGISLYSDSIRYVLIIVLASHISRDYHGKRTASVSKRGEQSES